MKANNMIDFYHLHFFKIKTREIDVEQVFAFFDNVENTEVVETDQYIEIKYRQPHLSINTSFYFTRKSAVQDLTELDPKYLEIRFHVKLPILTNDYSANLVFKLVKKLCDRFDFYVYNELFTDVMEYNYDTIMHSFRLLKSKYIETFPSKLGNKIVVGSHQMNDILRYIEDRDDLAKYYANEEVLSPNYFFVKDKLGKLYVCIELREMNKTIFPPRVDLVYYHYNNLVKIITFNSLVDNIDKYLNDVPGFIPGTKVLTKKKLKKVHKIIRKTKFTPPNQDFELVELDQLIDL